MIDKLMEFHSESVYFSMFKGTVIKMKNYNTDEIETIIKDLEENMKPDGRMAKDI